MYKKIYFLTLCLLANNLNGAESEKKARPQRAKYTAVTVLTTMALMATPSTLACPALAPLPTPQPPVTEASAAATLMTSVRDFSLAQYPWLGSDAKFRTAYPDWRSELGDTCETIPNSNQTLLCYNRPYGPGVKACIAKVIGDYIKTRPLSEPLPPAVFAKRMHDLERAGEACLKKSEVRHQPKNKLPKNQQRGANLRKTGRLKQ